MVAGGVARFRVIASGSAVPVAYQWFKGTTALGGQTNADLVLAGVQATDAGDYTVTLTTPFGGPITTRSPRLFTVGNLPTVTIAGGGPSPSVTVGGSVTLSVTAGGSPAPTSSGCTTAAR